MISCQQSIGSRDVITGAASIALFEDFQEIMPRGGGERVKPPIIEDEKVGSAEVARDAGMAPVPARQREGCQDDQISN